MVKLLPGIGNRTAENLWQAWAAGVTDGKENSWRAPPCDERPGKIKENVDATGAYP